jgi:hypothetical protein
MPNGFAKEQEKFRIESLVNLPERIKSFGIDEILKIEDFKTLMNFKETRVEARILCKIKTEMAHDRFKWLKYEYWNYLGSYYEPPDTDEWLGQDYVT